MRAFPFRWLLRLLVAALLLAWAAIALWQSQKRLPPGVHIAGAWHSVPARELRFLRDLTAADATGAPLNERQINAELLHMVAQARDFLVLDTGLFGDLPAAGRGRSRLRAAAPVAAALADALLQARQQQPGLQVLLLIDPASVQMGVGPNLPERLRRGRNRRGVGRCRPAACAQCRLCRPVAAVLPLVEPGRSRGCLAQSGRRGTFGRVDGTVGPNPRLSAQPSSAADRR